MHTIASLRKALGLTTANQVRNRIEAVRDVLEPHLKRGPNNQILVTDEGLACLRQLQELYDSGLTMAEASEVMRSHAVSKRVLEPIASSGLVRNRENPDNTQRDAVRALQDEISFLCSRIAELESRLATSDRRVEAPAIPWWSTLREDVDVA